MYQWIANRQYFYGSYVFLFDSEGNIPELMDTNAQIEGKRLREYYVYADHENIVYCVTGKEFARFLKKHKNEAFIDFPNGHPNFD